MTSGQPIHHGRASGYTHGRCRCEPCTASHRAAIADYRARRRAAGGARLGFNGTKRAGAWVWSRRPANRRQLPANRRQLPVS